jgi:ferritin
MSEWLELSGFLGASKLWAKYASEESKHATWTYNYMAAHDYLPEVGSLAEVKKNFESLVEIVYESYKEELRLTKQCNELSMACAEEGDFSTMVLAYKYMKEQTEELEKFNRWVSRLTAMGDNPKELRMLDDEMGEMASGSISVDKSY